MTTVMVPIFVLGAMSPAVGFPNDVDENCDISIDQPRYFHFVGTWDTDEKNAVRDGILDWNGILDYTGEPLVEFVEDDELGDIHVSSEDLDYGLRGVANCGSNTIRINNDAEWANDPQQFMRPTARHEIAHLEGLEHTGELDSFGRRLVDPPTNPPTTETDNPTVMSTCADDPPRNEPSQEDVGSMTFSHSRLNPASNTSAPLTANFGFEQGTSYWGITGGALDDIATGGATGPGHVRFDPADPEDYIFQTMAYADAPEKEIKAVLNFKRNATNDTGTVVTELWARPVTYGTDALGCGDGLSEWPNGKNMNVRSPAVESTTSWLLREALFDSPTTSWTSESTLAWTTLSTGNQDIQIRVSADMTDTVECESTAVLLDNVRIECVSSQSSNEADCE